MIHDSEVKEQIVQITHELFAQGLLTATGGNVSAVASDGATVWITPTGMFKGALRESDLVRIRSDGSVIEGDRPPSIEWRMHWQAYRTRPETHAAVHTHAPFATAFGITHRSFPPINTDAVLLRDTQLVPWHMPGSQELAAAAGRALERSRGCMLQNHGLLTVGDTLRKAATLAMMIEETARIVLYVKQSGGVTTEIPEHGIQQLATFAEFI